MRHLPFLLLVAFVFINEYALAQTPATSSGDSLLVQPIDTEEPTPPPPRIKIKGPYRYIKPYQPLWMFNGYFILSPSTSYKTASDIKSVANVVSETPIHLIKDVAVLKPSQKNIDKYGLFVESGIIVLSLRPDYAKHFLNKIRFIDRIPCLHPSVLEYDAYFSIWVGNQVVEVWEKDGMQRGNLTNWVAESPPNDEPPTHRVHFQRLPLGQGTASRILQLADSLHIASFPPQDSIAGWSDGFDGETYTIETFYEGVYSTQNYWSPSTQGDLIEAVRLQFLTDEILKITRAEAAWKAFAKTIPFECWMDGGGGSAVTCQPPKKKYKRERKRYRQQF